MFFAVGPREHETAENEAKRCASNLRKRARLPPLVLMATRPELLGVKAAKCYVAAQKAKDPETRDAYLELMRHWRELADEIERFEHAWLDREGI